MSRDFTRRLAETAAAVETTLRRLLAADRRPEAGWPQRLAEAMAYAVFSGGKRFRPFVLMEAAALFGASGDGVLRAAAAVECVHCYSLVHDDLPAMDDDDLRRGKPTVHRAFDEATAILVGDALLTVAFGILADPATDQDAAVRLALVECLARAAGPSGMVGGQALDMAGEGRLPTAPAIAEMQAMKTGALFRFAAEAGAIIGRALPADRARLVKFGVSLGAAFQLADDLLDARADIAGGRKAGAKDGKRARPNTVALVGEQRARSLLRERIGEAESGLEPFGEKAATLVAVARFIGVGS